MGELMRINSHYGGDDGMMWWWCNDNMMMVMMISMILTLTAFSNSLSIPQTRHVRGSNYCFINVIEDRVPGRAIIISAIDNLVKGASGQAIQNMNIMLGFEVLQYLACILSVHYLL